MAVAEHRFTNGGHAPVEARGWISERLRRLLPADPSADGHVHIAVTDNGPGWPRLRDASATDVHGRGLLVVSQLATSVGADPVPGGKRVWATLRVDPALRQSGQIGSSALLSVTWCAVP